MPFNKIDYYRLLQWGAGMEDVRTIFEKRDDATIYIPAFYRQAEREAGTVPSLPKILICLIFQ
jgi:hypothetical protein